MNEEQRKKWRLDLNYSIRTKYGINLEALPTKEGNYFHPQVSVQRRHSFT
jgi:hypothetical protein